MYSIRMTPTLKRLLERTAKHIGEDVSFVIRQADRGIRRGRRNVLRRTLPESYYGSGGEIIPVRGLVQPDMPLDEYRKQLALRCLEELRKPEYVPYQTPLTVNKDYFVNNEE